MRFLLSVIDSASRTGSTNEMAAINIFNEELQNNSHWIFACGVDSLWGFWSLDYQFALNPLKPATQSATRMKHHEKPWHIVIE